MADAICLDRADQPLHDVLLPNQIGEGLRAIASRDDDVFAHLAARIFFIVRGIRVVLGQ